MGSTLLITVIEIPCYILLPFLIDIWGRKPLFAVTQLLPGIFCIVAAFMTPGTVLRHTHTHRQIWCGHGFQCNLHVHCRAISNHYQELCYGCVQYSSEDGSYPGPLGWEAPD